MSEEELLAEIQEIEQLIQSQEELADRIQELLTENPSLDQLPEELKAFHPKSLYAMTVRSIAILKIKRIDLLLSANTIDKLNVLLKNAIESEDFEKAAEIRDKISDLLLSESE